VISVLASNIQPDPKQHYVLNNVKSKCGETEKKILPNVSGSYECGVM
jgi:hypothetical protein